MREQLLERRASTGTAARIRDHLLGPHVERQHPARDHAQRDRRRDRLRQRCEVVEGVLRDRFASGSERACGSLDEVELARCVAQRDRCDCARKNVPCDTGCEKPSCLLQQALTPRMAHPDPPIVDGTQEAHAGGLLFRATSGP
jgi:hypothetical protein